MLKSDFTQISNAKILSYFLVGKVFCGIIVPDSVVYRALAELNSESEFYVLELEGL